jgi:hypothetical protein
VARVGTGNGVVGRCARVGTGNGVVGALHHIYMHGCAVGWVTERRKNGLGSFVLNCMNYFEPGSLAGDK